MFEFIKRRQERPNRESILNDIKKAKDIYLSRITMCMCQSFYWVDENRYDTYDEIRKRIPEFKPETFNIDPMLWSVFWWPIHDRESRINAFDKLIEIYSK